MAIPTTSTSALALLFISALLLGLWSSTFKMAGNRWRFELFSLDFGIGSVLFALAAAYFFGTLGSDMSLTDHIMISSRTNQAYAISAGCLFAFGNMLLLSSISLLGLSLAYPTAAAAALLVMAVFDFNGERALLLGVAMAAAVITIIFASLAASAGPDTLPATQLPVGVRKSSSSSSSRQVKQARVKSGLPASTKGMLVGVVSGLALGTCFPALEKSVFTEFGLGGYAGLLLFCLGLLGATIVLNLFFMNIAIHGGRISIRAYFRGTLWQHVLGWIGGALCGGGGLGILLLLGFPGELQPDKLWIALAPLAAVLFAALLGLAIWREHSGAPGSLTRSLLVCTFFLAVAIAGYSLAVNKTPLPPPRNTSGLVQTQLPG